LQGAEPKHFAYDAPVVLTGKIVREFDMSFVSGDIPPLQDPAKVAQAVAAAKLEPGADPARVGEPAPHLILRLDRPIFVSGKVGDPSYPEERNVSEVDLGGAPQPIKETDLGKTRFVVSGTLWHSHTVHHLRPIMMKVTELTRAKKQK
jgi:hypothetical protein